MIYSDTFSQADESPLSSGGVWQSGYTNPSDPMKVVGNRVRVTTVDVNAGMTYTGAVPSGQQFGQITWATDVGMGLATKDVDILLRAADPPTVTFYKTESRDRPAAGGSTEAIMKFINGAGTELAVQTTSDWAANDVLKGSVIGTALSLYKNGSVILTATDSDITTGKIGFAMSADAPADIGDLETDNFIGGDWVSGPLIDSGHLIGGTTLIGGRLIQ